MSRKYKSSSRAHLDMMVCGKKRNRNDDYENINTNNMGVTEENTTQRRLKRGIRNVRKKKQNPAEVAENSKNYFFGVAKGKFTSQSRFATDVGSISISQKNKLSSIFAKADMEFLQLAKEEDNTEAVRELNEFPVDLESLYTNPQITNGKYFQNSQRGKYLIILLCKSKFSKFDNFRPSYVGNRHPSQP